MFMRKLYRQKDFQIMKCVEVFFISGFCSGRKEGECLKKHLKVLLAGAVIAGSILACTAAYARFSDSVTVTNHIAVEISIFLFGNWKKRTAEK